MNPNFVTKIPVDETLDPLQPIAKLQCAGDVQPQPINWLWPGRIALGKLTMIAGDPGLGKSLLSIELAKHVTKGIRWPVDDTPCPIGDVILLSAEDDLADTIRPRLDATGANPNKVYVLESIREIDKQSGEVIKRSFSLKRDVLLMGLAGLAAPSTSAGQDVRARDLGIPFEGLPGPLNAITDVPGIEVGHATIIRGDGPLVKGVGPVRTGVTAILPRGRGFDPVFAATYALNGNGEMTGIHWIEESGFLETPIMITNTFSVGVVRDAVIAWMDSTGHNAAPQGLWYTYPVVAETYDVLNDILGQHVTRAHAFEALNNASGGPVAEGNVGGAIAYLIVETSRSGIFS